MFTVSTKVLVADDESAFVELISFNLKRRGYDVLTVQRPGGTHPGTKGDSRCYDSRRPYGGFPALRCITEVSLLAGSFIGLWPAIFMIAVASVLVSRSNETFARNSQASE
jgi:hypothetical protein